VSPVDFVALSAGRMIGRYEVVSVLGQGGFGITYRAHDSQLGREVAIKEYLPLALAIRQDGTTVMPRSTGAMEDFSWGRERFVAEGRTLAGLQNSPAIVRVFDFLEANGTAYIVMQLLQGETLENRLKRAGPFKAPDIDRILWPLLDGLEQVHATGFLHRDIKPANILLDDAGSPTLIDFGASRAAIAGRSAALTAIFTPGYAAAEQMTSAKQGPWTDIYGLSATLYHAITGQTPPGAFDRMLDDGYEPLGRMILPGFSPGLLVGLDAGLALRASDRPQSIAGWRLILGQATAPGAEATLAMARQRGGAVTSAPPAPETESVAPSVEASAVVAVDRAPARSRVPLLAGIAVAVLALALGGYFTLVPGTKPVPATTALQDLKLEDLERVLADRRKADAAAAEKKRLEEEAQRKADADAAAKKAADTELEKAQQARLKAEQELAQMKADMETRRQAEAGQREQADAAARRAAEEAAQRKAEAEMAALRQAEDDARQKATAEADAKRQADEALVRAQAERQKAEAEAKQKAEAEARQKAESSTREVAEAEARQKAEAEARQKADAEATAAAAAVAEKKAAEAAETALRLASADRQRLQVALTSLGFDTRGNDGAFGPRTREMIAAWQKAHSAPQTGFLNGTENQALLKEAAPAISRFDDEQKKVEEAKKRADEDKAKAEAAAKAAPVPAVPAPAPATPSVAASAPKSGPDGVWKGSYECTASRNGGEFNMKIQIVVSGGVGTWTRPGGSNQRGNQSLTVRISGAQVAVSRLYIPVHQPGTMSTATMSARYEGNAISGGGPEANSGGRTCTMSLTRGP
jgi:serine/threonine protein kinase/peptidoglycan hydrolase-like protein with peptidoglycan-binding domain